MDFTFGKLISDGLKLENHRALLNGIQHRHNISPLDPAPGENVNVHLATASDPAIVSAELRYTLDGSDPRSAGPGVNTVAFRPANREWDTLVWDYITASGTPKSPASPTARW